MGLFGTKSLSDLFNFDVPSAPKLGAIFGAALTFGVMGADDAEARRLRFGGPNIRIVIPPVVGLGIGAAALMRPSRSFGMNCNPTVIRDGRGRVITSMPAAGCSGNSMRRSRPNPYGGGMGGCLRVRIGNGGYRCM